ncbi:uncharacterized protein LOC144907049 [Branchiostoma floridae x Branchiostoma belcheri]
MALRRSARARQPRLLPDFVSPDDIFGGHARDTKVKITKSYHDDLSNSDSTLCNSLAMSTTDSETENKDPTPLNYNLCNTDKPVDREDLPFKSWMEKTKEYDDSTILDDESLHKDTIDICNDSFAVDRFGNTAFKTVPSMIGATVLSEDLIDTDSTSAQDANVSSHKKSKIAIREVYTYKEKMASVKTFINPKRRKENTNFAEDSSIDPPIKLSSSKSKAEYSSFEAWPKRDTLSTNSWETTTQERRGINSAVFESDVKKDNDNQHDISSSKEDDSSEQQTSSSLVYKTDKEAESMLDVILDCESDDNEEDIYNQFEHDTIDSNSSPSYIIPFDPDEGAISNCDNQIPAPVCKPQRILKCPYCQYLAMKSSHLKRHVRKHTGERPYQCPHCRYSAMRKEHLHRHFGFKHKELLRVACQECRYRTTDEQSLNVHLKLTHPEIFNQVYKCGQCEFESARKSQYVEHTKLHRVWECPICRYSTGDWTTYRRHKQSHTEERPYTCHMCTYTAKLKVDLERHIRAHTGERPFTCPQCSYRGARKDSLVRHMRTHTGDKPYKCPLCEFASAQQGHLVTHIRTHTGERPFTCPCCEYACCDRSSLVKHVRIHTGERPYKCPHCPFAAIRNQDLKDHINIHTGQRPYKCSQCSYAAADRSTLRTHAKKHSQKSRFSCQQCEFSCACKATLVKHLKKHKGTRPFKEEIKEEKDVTPYRIPGQVKEEMADDTF